MEVKRPGSFSNGTTNAVRLYLRDMTVKYFDLSRDDTVVEITKIVQNDSPSKWLVHNLLFLHLGLDEIAPLKSDLSYFALVNLDWKAIDPELYIDLIFVCRLHEYFLQLIAVTRKLQFSRHLLSMVAERVLTSLPELLRGSESEPEAASTQCQEKDFQEQLTKEDWLLYLSILAWLSRASEINDQFYPHIHRKFLTKFLDLPESQLSTINKIEILIQLSGIACLKLEDYHGNTEICDSLVELNFDPLIRLLNETGTWEFFQTMFSNKIGKQLGNSDYSDIREAPISLSLAECMGEAIIGLKFDPDSEICQILHGTQMRISRKMGKTLRHIGDYAYLTNLIIKKNIVGQAETGAGSPSGKGKQQQQFNSNQAAASKIFMVTNFLEKFKSKSRCEDYDFRSIQFEEFCALLRSRSSAKYRHVQSSWHDKFLSFDEAFTTAEGCSLAEECIAPSTSYDIGIKMLKKILKIQSLTEEVKHIVLILIFNPNLYSNFDQVVDLLFKTKQVHEKFCTDGFQGQLNGLNVKLGGNGCFDLKTDSLVQTLIDECRRITVQNPLIAAQNILSRSLQLDTGGSQVLHSLKQFWNLKVPTPVSNSEASPDSEATPPKDKNQNLFEYCLEQLILTVTDELTRNVHSKSQLKKFMSVFLNDKFISKEKFEEILLSTVLSLLETQSTDKIVAVLDIYQDFICTILVQAKEREAKAVKVKGIDCAGDMDDFLQLVYSHMEGLREGTYISPTMDSNDFRDKTIEILNLLLDFNEPLLLKPIPATEANFSALELPLASLVLLYTRVSAWRPVIQMYVKSSQEFFENVGMLGIDNRSYDSESFQIPLSIIEEIVQNSSPLEWNDAMDIIYDIYYRLLDGDGVKAFEKWIWTVRKVPLFELVRKDETVSEAMEGPKKKRRDTLEMKSPPLVFQRFGIHLVKLLTGTCSTASLNNASTKTKTKRIGCSYGSELSKYPALQLLIVKSFVAVACSFPDEPQYFSAKQWTLMSLLDFVTWVVKVNLINVKSDKDKDKKNSCSNAKNESCEGDILLQCLLTVKVLKRTQQGKLEPICTSIINVLQVTQLKGKKKKKIASLIPLEEVGKESEVDLRLREMNEDALRMNTNRDCLPEENYCKMKILNINDE